MHLHVLAVASQYSPVFSPEQEATVEVHMHSPFPPFPAALQYIPVVSVEQDARFAVHLQALLLASQYDPVASPLQELAVPHLHRPGFIVVSQTSPATEQVTPSHGSTKIGANRDMIVDNI